MLWTKSEAVLSGPRIEAGELTLFINESQVAFLEDMMWQSGVLDTSQMAGAFQLLRSNDLIWSRVSREYLMGERSPSSDLMAWNADATRLPYRISAPIVSAQRSGRGPLPRRGKADRAVGYPRPDVRGRHRQGSRRTWKSVYKIHYQVDAEVTFLLTSGGHNAGIVAPSGEQGRSYQVRTKPVDAPDLGPDEWLKGTPK
jgi:polyhydroxyalkanoate synthase